MSAPIDPTPPSVQGDKLSILHTALYLALGVSIAVVELRAVLSRRRMDTISEHWWWLQDRFPFLRVLLVLFLLWLALHLGWRRF